MGSVIHRERGAFQSTLPAWGSDARLQAALSGLLKFQSTLPAWGSDEFRLAPYATPLVSIHAPRVGERLEAVTNGKQA